ISLWTGPRYSTIRSLSHTLEQLRVWRCCQLAAERRHLRRVKQQPGALLKQATLQRGNGGDDVAVLLVTIDLRFHEMLQGVNRQDAKIAKVRKSEQPMHRCCDLVMSSFGDARLPLSRHHIAISLGVLGVLAVSLPKSCPSV